MRRGISVVMCTFNGEKWLASQLDSIIDQSLSPDEIIIFDDKSTDRTLEILNDYSLRYPIIKVYQNSERKGFNRNFLDAINAAQGEFIAISDQDDIWHKDKLRCQVDAIGSNYINISRSEPFSDNNVPVDFDDRMPNNHLIHWLYYSMPGHSMVIKSELMRYLGNTSAECNINYDSRLLLTASAFGKVNIINRILSYHRRHESAATFQISDKRRKKSGSNALYILLWSLANYRKLQRPLKAFFSQRHYFIRELNIDNSSCRDALALTHSEGKGLKGFITLMKLHIKYRNVLFFTPSKGLGNFLRAALFPIMHVYNYRYLLEGKNHSQIL